MKKILFAICGLILAAGVFTSCVKTQTFTHYECLASFEPSDFPVSDPEVYDFYVRFNEEPDWNGMHYINRLYIKNLDFRAEDAAAMDHYNRWLGTFKEMETQFVKLCKELESRTDASFSVPVSYVVRRSVIGEPSKSKVLAEYSFVLKCNCD